MHLAERRLERSGVYAIQDVAFIQMVGDLVEVIADAPQLAQHRLEVGAHVDDLAGSGAIFEGLQAAVGAGLAAGRLAQRQQAFVLGVVE